MPTFTVDDAREAGERSKSPLYGESEISDILDHLGADKDKYDLAQVVKGANHELREHCMGKWALKEVGIVGAVKITLSHLDEDPQYYDHLDEMEAKHGKKNGPVSERLEEVLKHS